MTRKTVAWDGPHPSIGDYLAWRPSGTVFRIAQISPASGSAAGGGVVTLDLRKTPASGLPTGATVHNFARCAPADPLGPPRVRQISVVAGPSAVMRQTWRDPDDISPDARRAPREVRGFRIFCPLRRMLEKRGSRIERNHVQAADLFRARAEVARLGYTPAKGFQPITATAYGPRDGPTAAQQAQAAAARDIARLFARLFPRQREMLGWIVLDNRSLAQWCARRPMRGERTADARIEMGRLLELLEALVEHYDAEIDDGLKRGWLLAV